MGERALQSTPLRVPDPQFLTIKVYPHRYQGQRPRTGFDPLWADATYANLGSDKDSGETIPTFRVCVVTLSPVAPHLRPHCDSSFLNNRAILPDS